MRKKDNILLLCVSSFFKFLFSVRKEGRKRIVEKKNEPSLEPKRKLAQFGFATYSMPGYVSVNS